MVVNEALKFLMKKEAKKDTKWRFICSICGGYINNDKVPDVDHIFNLIFNSNFDINRSSDGFFNTHIYCNRTIKSDKLFLPSKPVCTEILGFTEDDYNKYAQKKYIWSFDSALLKANTRCVKFKKNEKKDKDDDYYIKNPSPAGFY